MPEPIVFVSRSRVKDGQLEGFREFLREGARASMPRNRGP